MTARFAVSTIAALTLALGAPACEGGSPLNPGDALDAGAAFGDGSPRTAEVDGRVVSASAARSTFTLESGVRVRLVSSTRIEADGDLLSLTAVEAALAAGRRVRAEADGVLDGADVIASTVKFEVDGPGDDRGNDQGNDRDDDRRNDGEDDPQDERDQKRDEQLVVGVDLGARTVTLADGTVVEVESDDLIDGGDLTSLGQVAAALRLGLGVEAELEFEVDSLGNLVLERIRFDIEDPADFEVEGRVEAVDLRTDTVVVAGTTVRLADDSAIDLEGDLRTLAEVERALAAGILVRAEAKGARTPSGPVAVNVKFETDD